jgi:hypothetical protein
MLIQKKNVFFGKISVIRFSSQYDWFENQELNGRTNSRKNNSGWEK